MDSSHNTNLPYTQTDFSSYALSKSMGAKKSRWISPSPKKKTMTQITASKKNAVNNNGTSNTKSLERNSLKRKSSLTIPDIDSKIKRLETLHEETATSDSDTTITKIDRVSKKRKLFKSGEESSGSEDLCKTLKSINNSVNQMTLLHPFSREEDIKIIRYFRKFMELLANKDDIYIYQLMEMKYHFQRSAKFLQDRFLNEILPNLYVYDCLSLEEMVIFYDRADMLVPKHVQNMIEEKVRSITGHGISSRESLVITISDSENEETDLIENERVNSPRSSISSPIVLKRRNKVLQLPSSPSICSTSISENALETVQNSDKVACNNSSSVMPGSHVFTSHDSEKEDMNLIDNENIKSTRSSESTVILSNGNNKLLKLQSSICSIPVKALQTVQNSDSDLCINSAVLSVNKESNSVNVVNMWDSAKHKSVETCQLVKDSDLSKHSLTSVNFCDENKCHRNVKGSKTEHSDNVNRDNDLEKITTNTCDTAEGSSCVFETSEKQQIKRAKNYNRQNARKHKKLVPVTTNFTKTVQSGNCNPNKVTKSSQTIQNDQSHDNFILHTDHTYVKLTQMIDKSLDDTSSCSNESGGEDKECISIKNPDNICISKSAETSRREPKIQDSVKSISKRSFVNASTNAEAPVTMNKHTQLSSLESNNIEINSCLESDAIELRINGNSNIYVSNKANVKKIAKQHKVLEDSIHLTDNKNMEILQSYTNYNSYINSAIKIFTENNMKDNNSRYNLRKFVKNPRGGTSTRRNIHWCKSGKRNVLDLLTKDYPSKVIKKPTRRTQRINKLFGIRQLKLRESKLRKKINKALCSPASDQLNETVSSATPSPISDTSSTTNSTNKECTKLSSGIVIRKTYLKTNMKSILNNQISTASPVTEEVNQSEKTYLKTNMKSIVNNQISTASPVTEEVNQLEKTYLKTNMKSILNNQISTASPVTEEVNQSEKTYPKTNVKSILNNQISTASPVTEEVNQSESAVTTISSVSNKPVCLGSDKPAITEIDVQNDYQKRMCKTSESDIQINTISPSITEKSNHPVSTVTSTTVTSKSLEDSNPENVIFNIKNNFEKRVYKKLESLYPIPKLDSSLITEESNQHASSSLASKNLVYIQINKNTGNVSGLRPVRTSSDKKDISNTETSKVMSVINNVNGPRISESINLISTVSGSDNTINPHVDKTVSDETISSTNSRVNTSYDMEINIFEDLPCEYDPTCSWDGGTSIQKNQNLVRKPNEIYVSTSRTIRNPAPGECTDEYSVIKPTRTYTRKTVRTSPPKSSCTVSVKTELNDPVVKLEPLNSSEDSGLEMIASQLLLGSPVASTSCAGTTSPCSSASDDVILIGDSPNCILDFLVDDIKTEMEGNTSTLPTNILDPIYETVPVNKEDVNITTHSFSTISEADSVWCTIKRIMSILESPIVLDDSEFACRRVVVKTKNTQTDPNITSTTCSKENDVQIKQELIEMNEMIKQEWIVDSDSCDNYPEMVFDCAKIKQEISILESNTITSPYFDEEIFDPVLPVQLPNENFQTHVNMSRKLKAVVAENRLSIHHLKPVTETEYATEQRIKTEYSAGTERE